MITGNSPFFSFLYMGCKLAPPGEYNWTVRVWWRCSLMSNYFDHLLLLFVVRLMLVFLFIAVVASCVNSWSGVTRWTLWERCLRRAASRTMHPTDGFRKESWRISTVNDGASSKKSAFTHSVFLLMCYYISRESYTTRNVCVSRCLCLSVRSRMPTLLHGPRCNLGEW